jgi:hypothetical protein
VTITTDQEELILVNSAIEQILTRGQDMTIRDNRVTKASLEVLYKRKDALQSRVDRALRGGIRIRGGTPV